jgi:hypothetical protein
MRRAIYVQTRKKGNHTEARRRSMGTRKESLTPHEMRERYAKSFG